MAYLDLPVEVDADVLKDEAVAALAAAIPGWEAAAGNLETILIEAISEMASEQATVAAQVPSAIFRAFGQKLVGIAPIDGVEAVGSTTWTLTDALSHTIPAGTFITIGDVPFQTSAEVTVPVGSTSATVPIIATEPGTQANGLTGDATVVDTLAFIESVALIGTTSGGVNAETDDDYLARLVEELSLMAPRPIVPTDFEVLARRIAGVERAVAVDGFNPVGSTYNNERMVAIAAVDEAGEAVSASIKTAIGTYLDGLREVNFVVNTIDPTYTSINVVATITVLPGFDPATTLAVAIAAVQSYLNPANWGRVTSGDGQFERPWVNTTKVGYLNIAEVIKRSQGVAFIDTLTVNGGTSNVTLSGAAPLTRAGTVTITQT